MKSIALASVMNSETYEKVDGLEALAIGNDNFSFLFEDFFCALQEFDYLHASVYATEHFEEATSSSDNMLAFLIELHRLVAKHLLLRYHDEQDTKSGVFATTQPMILNNGILQPSAVLLADMDKEIRDFCDSFVEQLKVVKEKINQKRRAFQTAAFALGEIGRIHIFNNGNGRLSRILMNCVLSFGEAQIVNFEDKEMYYGIIKRYIVSKDLAELIAKIQELNKEKIAKKIKNGENLRDDNDIITAYNRQLFYSQDKQTIFLLGDPEADSTKAYPKNIVVLKTTGEGVALDKAAIKKFEAMMTDDFGKLFLNRIEPDFFSESKYLNVINKAIAPAM